MIKNKLSGLYFLYDTISIATCLQALSLGLNSLWPNDTYMSEFENWVIGLSVGSKRKWHQGII